jgi:hypothetical protein
MLREVDLWMLVKSRGMRLVQILVRRVDFVSNVFEAELMQCGNGVELGRCVLGVEDAAAAGAEISYKHRLEQCHVCRPISFR